MQNTGRKKNIQFKRIMEELSIWKLRYEQLLYKNYNYTITNYDHSGGHQDTPISEITPNTHTYARDKGKRRPISQLKALPNKHAYTKTHICKGPSGMNIIKKEFLFQNHPT